MTHHAPHISYGLDAETSTFRIEGYNWAPPFSDFLPGVAGELGVPAWVYWVNRGQAVSGVGVADRDNQILELYSFNKACLRVATEGFRTFVRLDGSDVHEPFQRTRDRGVSQTLEMSPSQLRIVEDCDRLGLRTAVTYFALPGRRAAGLVRVVSLTDLSGAARRIEWLDGAPRVLPKGIDRHGIKVASRHIEAMMTVDGHRGVPLFRLRQTADDDARVGGIVGANFVAVAPEAPVVTDPRAVFADPFDITAPLVFADTGVDGVLAAPRTATGRTPCAFSVRSGQLAAGATLGHTLVMGRVERIGDLDRLVDDMADPGFAAGAALASHLMVGAIADHASTISASPRYDAYAAQSFLDNVLRGGMPVAIAADPPVRFHVFWRQNADLERDYHEFDLEATYLSQGMGHYRNLLQNRRNDSWFSRAADGTDLATFMGLIQLDGYNPLEIRHSRYRLDGDTARAWANRWVTEAEARASLLGALDAGPLTPGRLLMLVEDAGVDFGSRPWQRTLEELLAGAVPAETGALEAGFWVDHWHYNLDLIEGFLAVYPDRLGSVLLDPVHTFFDNPDVVVPRSERIVLADGRVRQYGAVRRDEEKAALIDQRSVDRHRARDRHGMGDVVRTSLLAKFVLLAATRLATVDPSGRGIEMEAGKPGWNDSLNGLPSMFGAGLSEMIELRRLLRMLGDWMERIDIPGGGVEVFEEIADLVDAVAALVDRRAELSPVEYWAEANSAKERYRHRVRLGVSGESRSLSHDDLAGFLTAALEMVDGILAGANGPVDADGVPHTYFVNEATEWRTVDGRIEPTEFSTVALGVFLEGAVHWMREFPEDAGDVYRAVRRSALYDEPLGMYRLSAATEGMEEAGRAVGAYPPGWLENGSVYTHMEYKYLLEVLRAGLCDQFWDDARTALIPFMDPAAYGRSPLQGTSFVVSSAHPDPSEHGRGYQPRLSGVTAEFLHIWLLAAAGPSPFRLDGDGRLAFAVEPRLPSHMFTATATRRSQTMPDGSRRDIEAPEHSFTFRMLGDVTITIHNPSKADTFGPDGVRARSYRLAYRDGHTIEVDGPVVPAPHAEAIRSGQVERIDVSVA